MREWPLLGEGGAPRSSTGSLAMWDKISLAIIALLCWALFNIVGGPLLRFFDLRTEIRRTMILFANVRARWKDKDWEGVGIPVTTGADLSPDEQERLRDAQIQYRDLASQMRAFADTRAIACLFLRALGFNPRKAASGLIGLSNSIDTYGKGRAFQIKTIEVALKFPAE